MIINKSNKHATGPHENSVSDDKISEHEIYQYAPVQHFMVLRNGKDIAYLNQAGSYFYVYTHPCGASYRPAKSTVISFTQTSMTEF